MDPTKSFDHLDPKLKDTYARVMGTAPGGTGDTTQNAAVQPALNLSAMPNAVDPTQNQFNAPPLDQTLNPTPNEGPNPGTGPTINSMPSDTTTMFSPPAETPPPPGPNPDTNSPTTSSFFSNPSPATADPTQSGGENSLSVPMAESSAEPTSAPITPYTPENLDGGPAAFPTEQFSQPLPSPSSVNQTAPHETSALLRVMYIIGAVIFFAIYTIFWVKVFNLPFLF